MKLNFEEYSADRSFALQEAGFRTERVLSRQQSEEYRNWSDKFFSHIPTYPYLGDGYAEHVRDHDRLCRKYRAMAEEMGITGEILVWWQESPCANK